MPGPAHTGWTHKRTTGDPDEVARWVPVARKVLGFAIQQAQFNGLLTYKVEKRLENGVLLIGELVGDKLKYYPTTTREEFHHMGRITDNLTSGKVFADLGLEPMNPETDRAMVCGSLAFNKDVMEVLEGFGLREGANSEPREYVVEKAFVGDGI